MQKIVFLVDGQVLRTDHKESGALVLGLSHLRLLRNLPNCRLRLLFLGKEEQRTSVVRFIAHYQLQGLEWDVLPLEPPANSASAWKRLLLGPWWAYLGYYFSSLTQPNSHKLAHWLQEQDIDWIWAEHFAPASLALMAETAPVIYAHHDFVYKIVRIRAQGRFSNLLRSYLFQYLEKRMAQRCTAFAGGADDELQQLQQMTSSQKPAFYAPTAYDRLPLPEEPATLNPRLVHLGGFGTTANKEGMRFFLREVRPRMHQQPFVRLIGNLNGAPPEVEQALSEGIAQAAGYVEDLSAELHPGDLHIIPYNGASGTRTRVPLALAHGQLLVAMARSVQGYRHLQHESNCLLAQNAEEMAQQLDAALAQPEAYYPLRQAGRQLFEEAFTIEGQLPNFREWWEKNLQPTHK